jgi:NAD(P)-dependent dehydrogenase (short-subunit alcohol dehydrogenase family)
MSTTAEKKRTVQELFDLTGRVAVVTGGAGLFGHQMTEALAEAGVRTFMADCDLDKLRTQTEVFRQAGLEVGGLQYDQASEPSIVQLLQQALDAAGKVDILVNGAVLRPMPDWPSPAADFAKSMEVNATGLFMICRAFGEHMAERGQGSIINISSIYGMVGPDYTHYEDLGWGIPPDYWFHKGGMLQLTKFLAAKFGPRGVRANAISPGGLFNAQDPRFIERYNARTYLERQANQTDLKGAIIFLASDASAYVTGANIVVDGGYTCK